MTFLNRIIFSSSIELAGLETDPLLDKKDYRKGCARRNYSEKPWVHLVAWKIFSKFLLKI
jgi:hypothetical protein